MIRIDHLLPFISHKCLPRDWGVLLAAAGRPRPLAVCLSRLGLPRSHRSAMSWHGPAMRRFGEPVRDITAAFTNTATASKPCTSRLLQYGDRDSANGRITPQRDWVPRVGSLIKKMGLSSLTTSCLSQPCHLLTVSFHCHLK